MRILHITYNWKPGRGGILNYVDNLTQIQKEYNEVYIMYFYPYDKNKGRRYKENGINFIIPEVVDDPLRRDNPELHYNNHYLENKILEEIINIKPDIVHIQTCYGISTRIIPLIESIGIRTVVHIHDYFCFCPKQVLFREDKFIHCYEPGKDCATCLNSSASNEDFRKRLEANIKNYNSATRIIAVSNYTKNIVSKLGLNDNKISVIINGVSSKLLLNRKRILNRPQISNNKLRFIHISPCSPIKGVVHLVEAFREIKEVKDGKIELYIYGAKSIMYEKLNKLSDDIDSIKIYPPYTYEQLDDIFYFADIAILPSLWWDTFPLTVFECMAYGLPVIGTKDSGMSEAIIDKFNGFLINPHNLSEIRELVRYLYSNQELVYKLKINVANSKIRTFSNVENDVMEIYKQIIEKT